MESAIVWKKILFLLSMLCYLSGCISEVQKNEVAASKSEQYFAEDVSNDPIIPKSPKLDVHIIMQDSILNNGDSVLLTITLSNDGSKIQRFLFDKPACSTGGPWGTTAKVVDKESGKSVLKYENKALLSSQIYTEEELQSHYYNLLPGQTIGKTYVLTDIVVFNESDYLIKAGTYEVQLFYYSNPSNVLTFTVNEGKKEEKEIPFLGGN